MAARARRRHFGYVDIASVSVALCQRGSAKICRSSPIIRCRKAMIEIAHVATVFVT
jgi:hypothetical protein